MFVIVPAEEINTTIKDFTMTRPCKKNINNTLSKYLNKFGLPIRKKRLSAEREREGERGRVRERGREGEKEGEWAQVM